MTCNCHRPDRNCEKCVKGGALSDKKYTYYKEKVYAVRVFYDKILKVFLNKELAQEYINNIIGKPHKEKDLFIEECEMRSRFRGR